MESSKEASNVWEDTQAQYALSLPEGGVFGKGAIQLRRNREL